MREISVSDDTVLLFGGSAPSDNTSVFANGSVLVGYCSDPQDPAGTFVSFPESEPNGNFRHGLGCFLCAQVTGTATVMF